MSNTFFFFVLVLTLRDIVDQFYLTFESVKNKNKKNI